MSKAVITLGSKATTLQALSGRLASARILSILAFTVADLRNHRRAILEQATRNLGESATLIVRSSCAREDTAQSSNAGAFLSVVNVRGRVALEGGDQI